MFQLLLIRGSLNNWVLAFDYSMKVNQITKPFCYPMFKSVLCLNFDSIYCYLSHFSLEKSALIHNETKYEVTNSYQSLLF